MRYIRKNVSAYCPEIEDIQFITVTFAEINILGAKSPGHKATSYSCDHASEHGCRHNGSNGAECPLLKKAIQMTP